MRASSRATLAAAWLAGALALGWQRAEAAAEASPGGAELAAAAVRAMGGAKAVAELRSLTAAAECEGPDGAYTSEIRWRRGGSTMWRSSDGEEQRIFMAVGDRAWRLDPRAAGGRAELPEGFAAVVHGHAFHPAVLELDRRFHEHRAAGTGAGGCLRVEMLDAGGRPAAVCLDPETMLPAVFSFTPAGPGGAIELRLSGWRRIEGLLFFSSFDLRQGEDRHRWVYSTIRPNAPEPAPPSGSRGAWGPGERISMSFKNADLADVLSSFARMAGFNLVLDPSVSGSVTVELNDVPWEQALETILRSHGLAAEIDGSGWRVRRRE